MSAKKVTENLIMALERHGFKAKIVSVEHVPELQETIKKNLASGKIDKAVYRDYGSYFDNAIPEDISWERSIIIIAAPRPILEVVFTIDGKKLSAIIPPTYEHSVDKTITAAIKTAFAPNGYRFTRADLPKKLLAAHSGLARYGKNNITFVDGMGSFVRLLAYYTDLPIESDNWQDPKVLDECNGCMACTKKCPTGAIDPNQFQLRAERCLTFHNESSDPFPTWIDKSWHHCLIGCMRCQDCCPVNKEFWSWTERYAEFTEKETSSLLKGRSEDELPAKWISKFQNSDLSENRGTLVRNLRSLFAPAL